MSRRLTWARSRADNVPVEARAAIEHLEESGIVSERLTRAKAALATSIESALAALAEIDAEIAAGEEPEPEPEPTPVPGDTNITIPDSIAEDGSEEVTAAINQWIAETPTGPGVVLHLGEGKHYHCELPVEVKEKTGFHLEAHGSTFQAMTDGTDFEPPEDYKFQWPRGRRHVELIGSDGVIIRDLIVRGGHPDGGPGQYVGRYQGQHAFHVRSDNVLLEGCTATDVYGDFIRLADWADGVEIVQFFGGRNGRQGIAPVQCKNVRIEDSHFGEIARSVIDIEPLGSDWGCIGLLVKGSTFGRYKGLWLSSGGGTIDTLRDEDGRRVFDENGDVVFDEESDNPLNVDDIRCEDCRVEGMHWVVKIQNAGGKYRRGSHTLINITSDQQFPAPVPAVLARKVDGLVVKGCGHDGGARDRDRTIGKDPPQPADALVYACDSTGVEVSDNDAAGFSLGELVEYEACGA